VDEANHSCQHAAGHVLRPLNADTARHGSVLAALLRRREVSWLANRAARVTSRREFLRASGSAQPGRRQLSACSRPLVLADRRRMLATCGWLRPLVSNVRMPWEHPRTDGLFHSRPGHRKIGAVGTPAPSTSQARENRKDVGVDTSEASPPLRGRPGAPPATSRSISQFFCPNFNS